MTAPATKYPAQTSLKAPPFAIALKYWKNLYLLALLSFLPFIINFTWGNHDWGWIKEYTPLLSGMFEGRYSQFILPTLLFEGNILPILTIITALAFYTAAAVLLVKLWKLPLQGILPLILSLNLITAPYSISWLYFAFIELSCMSWPFFVLLGFYLLNIHSPLKNPYLAFLLSTTLFTLSLGGYPPVINMMGVIFFTLILNGLPIKNLPVKLIIKKLAPTALSIALSVFLMLTIQYFLKKYHIQSQTYNTAVIGFSTLFPKLKTALIASLTQFAATTSFIPLSYKIPTLLLSCLALYILLKNIKKRPLPLFLFAISIIGLLLSSSLTLLAAQNEMYVLNEPRIDFFGLIYIYIFSAAILLKSSSPFIKNLTSLLLLTLLLHNINTISYAAKVWHLGFKAETSLAERIISRLEQTQNFNPDNNYTFIQGGTLDFRSRYYIKDNAKTDGYTLSAPYIPWHLPSKAYQFYYQKNFVTNDFDIYWSFVPPYALNKTPSLTAYLNRAASPWPQKNAVYIDSQTIILTLSPEGRTRAQNWLKTNR